MVAQEEQEWRRRFYKGWISTVLDSVPYKKPSLLGGTDMLMMIEQKVDFEVNPVGIGFFFLKPGRQYYVIRHLGKAFVSRELVKCRSEAIPQCK